MTTLAGKIVRDVTVELGASYQDRGWPADSAVYEVEITTGGMRIRYQRGPWYRIGWDDILVSASREQ